MKFEQFGKNLKKIGLVGLTASALNVDAQTAGLGMTDGNLDTRVKGSSDGLRIDGEETAKMRRAEFLPRLHKVGLAKEYTAETFDTLSKEEIDKLALLYAERIGAKPPAYMENVTGEITVVDHKKYGIRVIDKEEGDPIRTDTAPIPMSRADFNMWFALQVRSGNIGKKVMAPDGKWYLIELDPNYKDPSIARAKKGSKPQVPKNSSGLLTKEKESSTASASQKEHYTDLEGYEGGK